MCSAQCVKHRSRQIPYPETVSVQLSCECACNRRSICRNPRSIQILCKLKCSLRLVSHLVKQLLHALDQRMLSVLISVSNRESISFYTVSVGIIPDNILLIDHRRNCSAFLLSELRDPRIEVRQAFHPDHCIIILRIFRKAAGNIKNLYFLCLPVCTVIQCRLRNVLQFDDFLYFLIRFFWF